MKEVMNSILLCLLSHVLVQRPGGGGGVTALHHEPHRQQEELFMCAHRFHHPLSQRRGLAVLVLKSR